MKRPEQLLQSIRERAQLIAPVAMLTASIGLGVGATEAIGDGIGQKIHAEEVRVGAGALDGVYTDGIVHSIDKHQADEASAIEAAAKTEIYMGLGALGFALVGAGASFSAVRSRREAAV